MRLLPLACLMMAGLPAAVSAAPLVATIGREGNVTVRESASGKTVCAIRPGLFEVMWQSKGVVAPPGGNGSQGIIRTNDGKSVTVTSAISAGAQSLRCRYEFATEAPLNVNSVHVSINVPASSWTGGRWTLDGQSGQVPMQVKDVRITSAPARSLTLRRGAARLAVSSEAAQSTLLQDGRYFGGGELEIRIGKENGSGWIWQPNDRQVVEFTLNLGAPVSAQKETPVTLKANAEWIPLQLKQDIEPKSALDFSFLDDAPAGKHGRVIATPAGHFAFAQSPNKPVRFYGVNLCFSANYLSHEMADKLADRLARSGYNTVRIHHYESGLVDQNAPNSLTFLPDSVDKLDYLFAALKKRGIYVKTDLFVSRPIKAGEMPGEPSMDNFKMATLVSDEAMANWKAFARELLEHVNPYTGMAYKDDPALAFLSMVNEPNATCYLGGLTPELRALYQQRWEAWLKARYANDSAVQTAWGEPNGSLTETMPTSVDMKNAKGRDLGAFLASLHEKAYQQMSAFLRQEVGTKALFTYLNGWSETPAFMATRTHFDWVDNHFYWDHPRFLGGAWKLPSEGGSGGSSALDQGGTGPNNVAMTRLYGKPFSVSEYNYAAPNPFRAESGLIMGAGAAIQDWDAIWRFAYSHSSGNIEAPGALGFFDMAADPAQQASERAAVMLFVRRDAAPAEHAYAADLNAGQLMRPTGPINEPNLSGITLVSRVGVTMGQKVAGVQPAEAADAALKAVNGDSCSSDTNQVAINKAEGSMRLATPRTAGVIAHAGENLSAGPVAVKVEGARAAVWASSLDGKPIAESKRMLLCHVTDVQNTNMRYASQDMRVLEDWGGLPHLARAGKAEVIFTRANGRKLRAWRLDTSGKRVAELPVRMDGNRATLDLSTADGKGGATLYYEVAAE